MILCDTSVAGAARTVHAMSVAAPAVLSHHPVYLLGEPRVGKTALLVVPGRGGLTAMPTIRDVAPAH